MPAVVGSDIIAHSRTGSLIVAVEVKNREELTPEIATILRRNRAAQGILSDATYFMIVSQDKGYLWVARKPDERLTPPDFEFPMASVVRRHVTSVRIRGRLRGPELEDIVFDWLAGFFDGEVDLSSEPERTLSTSGVVDALRGATVSRVTS